MAAAAARTDPALQHVVDLWAAWERSGPDGLLDAAGADVQWAAHVFDNRPMSTVELREHYLALQASGARITARAERFEVHGEHVLVEGRLRVSAPGHVADKHLVWVYEFDDGRLVRAYACTSRRAALEAAGA